MNAPRAADQPTPALGISILHVEGCPLVGRLRTEVEHALASIGATAVIEEIEGAFPSPTLLIDGVELEGSPLGSEPACRLELPSREQIVSALLAAPSESTSRARTGAGINQALGFSSTRATPWPDPTQTPRTP
jgi:hypothetical protein